MTATSPFSTPRPKSTPDTTIPASIPQRALLPVRTNRPREPIILNALFHRDMDSSSVHDAYLYPKHGAWVAQTARCPCSVLPAPSDKSGIVTMNEPVSVSSVWDARDSGVLVLDKHGFTALCAPPARLTILGLHFKRNKRLKEEEKKRHKK